MAGPQSRKHKSSSPLNQTKETEFRIESTPYEKRIPSCAECRRLKRKCDRKWPCQSCIQRGCASICPNGSLAAEGGGTRLILRKLKDMSKRIGQLEDALGSGWVGSEEHPLLKQELLKIKSIPDAQVPDEESELIEDVTPVIEEVDALTPGVGTLALGTRGKMNYMGRTAKAELILKAEELDPLHPGNQPPSLGSSPDSGSEGHILPPSIQSLAHSFLLNPNSQTDATINDFREYLPALPHAISLSDLFFSHAGWFYSPIPRDDFLSSTLLSAYGNAPTAHSNVTNLRPASPTQTQESPGPHSLALIFIILSVGRLLDVSRLRFAQESAEKYLTLAKAALSLEPLTNGCSIALVQTLNVLIYRSQWDENAANGEVNWAILGLACKMSLTLGLHRDSAKWNLTSKEVNQRRSVFWELFSSNLWASIGHGRPPALQLHNTDCQFPDDPEEKSDPSGKVIHRSFQNYKHHFTRECLWPILDYNYNLTKTFNYASVMALDRRVREFDFGNVDRSAMNNTAVGLLLQKWVNKNCKDHVLLHLHRMFFTRALSTHPDSPLDSPYASSVLTSFKCSVSLLSDVENIYRQVPARVVPIGLSWSYALSSTMAIGAICTKGPRGSLAPVAYERLKLALVLAENLFSEIPRASSGLTSLRNLLQTAHQSIATVGPGPTSSISFQQPPDETQPDVKPPQSIEYGQHSIASTSATGQVLPPRPPPIITSSFSHRWTPSTPSPHLTSHTGTPIAGSSVEGGSYMNSRRRRSSTSALNFPQETMGYESSQQPVIMHQPTFSNRPPGAPAQPDEYAWMNESYASTSRSPHPGMDIRTETDEPPAKRYRYTSMSAADASANPEWVTGSSGRAEHSYTTSSVPTPTSVATPSTLASIGSHSQWMHMYPRSEIIVPSQPQPQSHIEQPTPTYNYPPPQTTWHQHVADSDTRQD